MERKQIEAIREIEEKDTGKAILDIQAKACSEYRQSCDPDTPINSGDKTMENDH